MVSVGLWFQAARRGGFRRTRQCWKDLVLTDMVPTIRLFGAGEKLRSLRKETSPVSEQAGLRRRPLRQVFRWSQLQADFTTRGNGVNL